MWWNAISSPSQTQTGYNLLVQPWEHLLLVLMPLFLLDNMRIPPFLHNLGQTFYITKDTLMTWLVYGYLKKLWLPQEINKSNTCNNFKNLLISRVCDRVCIVVPVRSSGPTASPPAFGGYVKWSTSYVLHTALQVVGCCLCNYYLHLRTTHLSLQPTA